MCLNRCQRATLTNTWAHKHTARGVLVKDNLSHTDGNTHTHTRQKWKCAHKVIFLTWSETCRKTQPLYQETKERRLKTQTYTLRRRWTWKTSLNINILRVTFQSGPVLDIMLHPLYLFLLFFDPSACLTPLRPKGSSPAGPPGCPELPYKGRKLQGQGQAPTAGYWRHPDRTPDRWAGGLIRTDTNIDPNAKPGVSHPEILAPEPLQHWHLHTKWIVMEKGWRGEGKDTSKDQGESEGREGTEGGNNKESGRGGDTAEGEAHCQVAIGWVKEDGQRELQVRM